MSLITTNLDSGDLAAVLTLICSELCNLARELYPQSNPVSVFEAPRRREFGDFATNMAFGLAKSARKAPALIAEHLAQAARDRDVLKPLLTHIEATAGFINIRLAPSLWHAILARMLREGDDFGRNGLSDHPPVSLEFGSANPTGPMVVVQGRTVSIGATLANAMRFCGIPVTTEWLINDAGNQLETFGRSIYARYRQITQPEYLFPPDGYPGDYVLPLAERLRQQDGARWENASESEWLPVCTAFGRNAMVAAQQKTCERFGAHFDLWQSEQALHASGAVERGIAALSAKNLTYEQDGALWFAATRFGDDKDRVLTRSDGRPTYYAGDVAYHNDKYARGAERIIDILGPDHHGYIGRLKALVTALGHEGTLEVLIAQQMTLMRGDEHVKMSKRAGQVLTLDEVLDEVGSDAARFFFIQSSTDSPLTFDLELARKTNDENPVYYVKYGHARIASVLRRAPAALLEAAHGECDLSLLTHPSELTLIARLAEFPQIVTLTAIARAPHRLARYARDVASDFHQFYAHARILTDDAALSSARLALALAAKHLLATVLHLTGVEAPESM